MTPEQSAAYINAMAAGLNATVAGMKAENTIRRRRGEALAYNEADFRKAIEESGCYHNAVMDTFAGVGR